VKKTFAVLMVAAFPLAALAAGEHAGGHGHDGGGATSQMPHDSHSGGHGAGQMPHGGDMRGAAGGMHDAAAGRPGDPAKVSRTIEVTMHDTMRFSPERIRVKAGETIRFFVRNTGDLPHEFVIGSIEALKEHAAMMRAQPGMKHAEPNMVSVGPGKMGGLVWYFEKPGVVEFACLVPGHFEAGMVGQVEVE
jgi:uncharacterized cupredoxin-like copper-binding protein